MPDSNRNKYSPYAGNSLRTTKSSLSSATEPSGTWFFVFTGTVALIDLAMEKLQSGHSTAIHWLHIFNGGYKALVLCPILDKASGADLCQ